MKTHGFILAASLASSVSAARPSNTSICDYYSSALFFANNATTQNTLLILLVNTAVIGNYSQASKSAVPGILAKDAKYNGTDVNLAKYFDGSLMSSNRGGKHGKSVNFLDGGGAAPLEKNKAADNEKSNQYMLLTHLYSYFGLLLGCSDVAKPGFPAYGGDTSMYSVHNYMGLDAYEVQYFIQQVGLSAASFGVAEADIAYVGHALEEYFGCKCAPKTSILPKEKKELQSICIADDCPTSPNATCKAYGKVMEPQAAKGSSSSSTLSSSSSSPGSSSSAPSNVTATGGAASLIVPVSAGALAVLALGVWYH